MFSTRVALAQSLFDEKRAIPRSSLTGTKAWNTSQFRYTHGEQPSRTARANIAGIDALTRYRTAVKTIHGTKTNAEAGFSRTSKAPKRPSPIILGMEHLAWSMRHDTRQNIISAVAV